MGDKILQNIFSYCVFHNLANKCGMEKKDKQMWQLRYICVLTATNVQMFLFVM
jgi:hypothetical protein